MEGLQKFTDSAIQINTLLNKNKILQQDIDQLTEEDQQEIFDIFTHKLNNLKGIELDKFKNQVLEIMPKEIKNQLWENNHSLITTAISQLLKIKGRMPAKTEIAEATGLSRPTIYKHLREYRSSDLFKQQIEQFRLITSSVLVTVFNAAKEGDMAAAKLYFNVIGNLDGEQMQPTRVKNQNNYIQINGTIINQEVVNDLKPEQLKQIQEILSAALPLTQQATALTLKND
jgi:ABC-type transporter MlaC component